MRLTLLVIIAILIVPSASAARRDCVDLPFDLGCPPRDLPTTPRLPGVPGGPGVPGVPSLPPGPAPPGLPGVPPLPEFPPALPELPDNFAALCATMPPVPASTRPVSERLEALGHHHHLADDVEGIGEFARDPGERCAQTIG